MTSITIGEGQKNSLAFLICVDSLVILLAKRVQEPKISPATALLISFRAAKRETNNLLLAV